MLTTGTPRRDNATCTAARVTLTLVRMAISLGTIGEPSSDAGPNPPATARLVTQGVALDSPS